MNKLISIGYTGIQSCYLNVDKKEAIRRYNKEDGKGDNCFELEEDISIYEFEFKDEFGAYDVWDI